MVAASISAIANRIASGRSKDERASAFSSERREVWFNMGQVF
jgi:hypothetical protein